MIKENKEIMGLRFDNERSMMEDMPIYIRKHLMSILSYYAQNIFKINNRKWTEYTLTEHDYNVPYSLNK